MRSIATTKQPASRFPLWVVKELAACALRTCHGEHANLSCAMETAEHREPCESRGSRTDLFVRTSTAEPHQRPRLVTWVTQCEAWYSDTAERHTKSL